jgi:hypothetical protein
MTPARTWILVIAIAAAVTAGVLALAAALERRPPGRGALWPAPEAIRLARLGEGS